MKPKNLYPWGFLALPEKLSRYETAKAVVLPIPYDATVSYGAGTRNGPSAMIAASRQSETYDPEFGGDPSTVGIATLGELEQVASGPAEMMDRVESTAKQILRDGKFLMSLGGEHSISYGLIKAHKKKYSDLTVLHFDAHTDLRTEYQGSPYSHASIMSHVWELCDFVSVGIRSFCGSDVEKQADSEGRLIRPTDLRKNCDFTSIILSMLSEHVYITFDLDGFDPAVMPSVGTPEPGGLLWDETLALIRATGESKRIVGADVVELAPISGLIYPDFAAARLAYKIISNALWSK